MTAEVVKKIVTKYCLNATEKCALEEAARILHRFSNSNDGYSSVICHFGTTEDNALAIPYVLLPPSPEVEDFIAFLDDLTGWEILSNEEEIIEKEEIEEWD